MCKFFLCVSNCVGHFVGMVMEKRMNQKPSNRVGKNQKHTWEIVVFCCFVPSCFLLQCWFNSVFEEKKRFMNFDPISLPSQACVGFGGAQARGTPFSGCVLQFH